MQFQHQHMMAHHMQVPQQQPKPAMPAPMTNAEPEAVRNLMINYIPTSVDEQQLRQLFEAYGPIESIKIVCDRETRQSKGYGFVKYRFWFSATQAIQALNGYPLLNKRLKVAYANQAEAAKIVSPESAGAVAPQASPYGVPDPMAAAAAADPNWLQQMQYMQFAAMQQLLQQQAMLQQQGAYGAHQHHHQHQHQHGAPRPGAHQHQQ